MMELVMSMMMTMEKMCEETMSHPEMMSTFCSNSLVYF